MREFAINEVPADIRPYFEEVRGASVAHPT
ncbi:hypothetical protein SEA_TECHAGE_60 [Mycobacterium phage Techage]|uniref:Uncharacterized protein n=1 Tax=Mycobacterium phage Techage TaxID=2591077 RepID=A0A514A5T4_9CAUD|nr:hypothetical protein SEA_TECHAGE_60 [Mycobacterium phage Techage]